MERGRGLRLEVGNRNCAHEEELKRYMTLFLIGRDFRVTYEGEGVKSFRSLSC
jgi:hypothetical protein